MLELLEIRKNRIGLTQKHARTYTQQLKKKYSESDSNNIVPL